MRKPQVSPLYVFSAVSTYSLLAEHTKGLKNKYYENEVCAVCLHKNIFFSKWHFHLECCNNKKNLF